MTLPNIKNVRNLAGEAIFQVDQVGPYNSLGHQETFSVNYEVTTDPIYTAISGARVKADIDETEKSGSGTFVLRETGARQLAMASLAAQGVLTQSAAVGEVASGTAKAGDIIDLGYLDVTINSITDGLNPLVAGIHYTLDAAAGLVTFLVDTDYDIGFGAAEITAANNRSIMNALSVSGGIRGNLRIVQKQTRGGTRFMWTGYVVIYPDGELQLHNDNGDKVTVPFRFDVLEDTTKPAGKRFGELIELPA